MKRRLPPAHWLHTFAVAADNLSFTAAARELGMTQSAVSQQIKQLEAHLGQPLFRRLAHGVQLTDAGSAYLPGVRRAFDQLAAGTTEVFGGGGGVLTIKTTASFAALWLAPRLRRFKEAFPGATFRVVQSLWPADFDADGVDLEIRYGRGDWPGLEAWRLTWDSLVAVAAPWYRRAVGLEVPADLSRAALLHVTGFGAGWPHWLSAVGAADVDAARGDQMDTSAMALEMAALGCGVALGRSCFVGPYFEKGRLEALFGGRGIPAEEAFYLVHPFGRPESASVGRFKAWLTGDGDPSFVRDADKKEAPPKRG
jgi:LysR family glycine cleavage system transcriptional activator